MTAPPTIECPKCFSAMRRVERSGVVVDHCTGCGGVFLDRGELEHLIQGENAYLQHETRRYDDDDDDDDYRDRDRNKSYKVERDRHGRPVKKKKKRGFLEDLLDFG